MIVPELIKGDLLDQKVDVIVNAWNRNLIPWWLLLPQGVSGAIKKRGGYALFREIAHVGIMSLGSAVLTGAGKLPFLGIIHVAGINLFWLATEYSIRESVRSAIELVNLERFSSVAFPVIGSGSGNRSKQWALDLMLDEFKKLDSSAHVVVVEFVKYRIKFHSARCGLDYYEDDRKVFIDSEMLGGDFDLVIWKSSIKRWEPPYEHESITEADRDRILGNVINWCDKFHLKVDVDDHTR